MEPNVAALFWIYGFDSVWALLQNIAHLMS